MSKIEYAGVGEGKVPVLSPSQRKADLYVHTTGLVFKKGVYQKGLKGDYEKQTIIEETEPIEEVIEETVEEQIEEVQPELPTQTTAPETVAPIMQPKAEQKDYDALIYALSKKIEDLEQNQKMSVPTQQPTVQTVIQQKEVEFGEGVRNIPPDDFDKKGAIFICYGLGQLVSAYIKDGSEYLAPYKKSLEFKHQSSDKRRTGREETILHFSKCQTHSKKEIEFLRSHPQYGISIYEGNDARKALEADPDTVAKMAAATSMISNLRQDNLFVKAASYGINVNLGYDAVKAQLIATVYNELVAQENKMTEKRLNDTASAISLFQNATVEQ